MHFGRTKGAENESSSQKCRLTPVSILDFWYCAQFCILGGHCPPVPAGDIANSRDNDVTVAYYFTVVASHYFSQPILPPSTHPQCALILF